MPNGYKWVKTLLILKISAIQTFINCE